jgi:DNA replicative helicase MCM subunit Mcm2 (Cdc46/Mcm family)
MGDFNDALESGEVYVDKIVKGKVITDCSAICGCNPDNGNKKKWIRGEQLSYADQLGLDFTITQRFAAIFVLEDIPDLHRDEQIGLSMIKGVTENEDVDVDPNKLHFIQKYIAMSKEINPLLTPGAANYIAKEHARKRAENQGGSDTLRSHRQVNALARLTTAIARFDFSTKATMTHVRYAESILAETLEEKDPGLIRTGKTLAERQLEDECKEQITLYFDTLTTEAKTQVHNVEQIHKFICDNLGGGWRQPTRLEVSRWVSLVSDDSLHIDKYDEDNYALKTEE